MKWFNFDSITFILILLFIISLILTINCVPELYDTDTDTDSEESS